MTYNFVKKTCPHCKKTISVEVYKGAKRKLYGSPLCECPKCSKSYVDKEIDELACGVYNEPPTTFFPHLVRNWLGIIISLWIAVTGFWAGDFSNAVEVVGGVGIFVVITGLCVVFPTWYSYKKRFNMREEYIAEWSASQSRLLNPEYAFKLYLAKYNVPERYLAPIKDRIAAVEKERDLEQKDYNWAKKVVYEFGADHPAVKEIAKMKGVSRREVISYYETIIRDYNNRQ